MYRVITKRRKVSILLPHPIVLHTGADQLKKRAADSVLESIASQISHVKQNRQTNQVFVCSVEERQDAGFTANETVKTVNEVMYGLCIEYGAKFLDLRQRMADCIWWHQQNKIAIYIRSGKKYLPGKFE